MIVFLAAGAFALVVLVLVVVMLRSLLRRASPDEILVVTGAGKPRLLASHLQLPLLELVDRLDLRPFELTLEIPGEAGRPGGRLFARAQISREPEALSRAARRLLDLTRSERARIVERVLEASARGILIAVPGGAEHDPLAFTQHVIAEADHQLAPLGLRLDALRLEP